MRTVDERFLIYQVFHSHLLTNREIYSIMFKVMREWRNRQTRTFEGRVSLMYGFKSRFPHQQKACYGKPFCFLVREMRTKNTSERHPPRIISHHKSEVEFLAFCNSKRCHLYVIEQNSCSHVLYLLVAAVQTSCFPHQGKG